MGFDFEFYFTCPFLELSLFKFPLSVYVWDGFCRRFVKSFCFESNAYGLEINSGPFGFFVTPKCFVLFHGCCWLDSLGWVISVYA